MTLLIGEPSPGFYRMKRVKGGVWVPVLIYRPCPLDPYTGEPLQRWYHLRALVDGQEEVRPLTVWTRLHPISCAEYLFLVGLHAWARDYAPGLPEARTKEPIDLGSMPPLF
jgi:hypothetical protein